MDLFLIPLEFRNMSHRYFNTGLKSQKHYRSSFFLFIIINFCVIVLFFYFVNKNFFLCFNCLYFDLNYEK